MNPFLFRPSIRLETKLETIPAWDRIKMIGAEFT